jgi:Fur family ferric uptake transcriptional regulator
MKDRIDTTADASSIERLCIDKGLCMTDQRRIIARILSIAYDHPDIEELHRRVREIDSRISLSTVYRTVRLLCGFGIIEKHNFGFGRARLESAPDKHHDHLIDVHSGKVVEFRSDAIEGLLAEIANRLGYRIIEHKLELYAVPAPNGRSAS